MIRYYCEHVYHAIIDIFIIIIIILFPQTQLESIGVTNIYPKTGFSEDELKLYLATPPAGKLNIIK